MWVLITGDWDDGFKFIGPFKLYEDAEAHSKLLSTREGWGSPSDKWTIQELLTPEGV